VKRMPAQAGGRVRVRPLMVRGTLRRAGRVGGSEGRREAEDRQHDTNPRVGVGDGNIARPTGRRAAEVVETAERRG